MKRRSACLLWVLVAAFAFAGCRSVAMPRENFFRLELPPAGTPGVDRTGVLRVFDLQIGTALDRECLLVRDGLRIEPRQLDRWMAPLDRMVTDALVLGLSRSRVFSLVKGAGDPGRESWSLHGRIVEFAEVRAERGSCAQIALELWLEDGLGQLLFQHEFQAQEPIVGAGAEAVVAALSRGLAAVVGSLVLRMQGEGLFVATTAPAAANR